MRVVASSATGNAPAKCPTCRCEFSLDDITLDAKLRERMQRASTVTCQYEGCNAQLSLQQVAIHEQTCSFVPMKCRYSTFGCEWKGTRQSLTQHEEACPLMQVSGLVEQFRQSNANHEHAITHLQSRVSRLVAGLCCLLNVFVCLLAHMHNRILGCRFECHDGTSCIHDSTSPNAKLSSY